MANVDASAFASPFCALPKQEMLFSTTNIGLRGNGVAVVVSHEGRQRMPLSGNPDGRARYCRNLRERGLQIGEIGRNEVIIHSVGCGPMDKVTAPVLADWRGGEGIA